MAARTADDELQRLLKLADLATSPNDNEARSAALKACELVREHRQALRLSTSESGPIHPLAALFKKYGMSPQSAYQAEWCVACGERIERNEPIVQHHAVGATHHKCRAWWQSFDFSSVPLAHDDDVPF